MMAELTASLEDEEDDMEVVVPDGDISVDDWNTGVEGMATWTPDKVWNALGCGETRAIPFFNRRDDPMGTVEPWSEEGLNFQQTNMGTPLEPRWHQLLGIIKMLQNMFEGRPILLMDEVGVGKTLQVIGFICFRAFFRQYYTRYHRYPGMFGKSRSSSNTRLI